MARVSKKGLEYFPMDIDIFSDIKIRKLIKYQGGKAISIYALLLCNIYKNGYYLEWDDELPFICSEMTGFDEAYVSEVIKTCLSLGLFSKEMFDEGGVLTSKGIQKRYNLICIQSRRVCEITDYSLIVQQAPRQPRNNSKANNKPGNETDKQVLTLDQEIEKLKTDALWLDGLESFHSMNIDMLRNSLDDFRVQCMADGKERGHKSLADAKQHFNSWLRIVNKNKNNNKNKEDEKSKSKGRNQRRGNVLSADEKKTYGDTF